MNFKKVLLIFVAFVCFGVIAFAGDRFTRTVIFNNDKLNISSYFGQHDSYGNGSFWVTETYIDITNKTNFEMRVTANYKVRIIDYDGKTTNRNFTNRVFTIKPGSYISIASWTSPEISGFRQSDWKDVVHVYDFELVNFSVNERNMEVPW